MSEFEEARKAARDCFVSRQNFQESPSDLDVNDAIDAFLAELRKTYAIVPREPTDAMIRTLASWADPHGGDDLREGYRAMLAAAAAYLT